MNMRRCSPADSTAAACAASSSAAPTVSPISSSARRRCRLLAAAEEAAAEEELAASDAPTAPPLASTWKFAHFIESASERWVSLTLAPVDPACGRWCGG